MSRAHFVPPQQTGLSQLDVQVTGVSYYVDLIVTLEGIFSLSSAQQSTLIGVRPCCVPRRISPATQP